MAVSDAGLLRALRPGTAIVTASLASQRGLLTAAIAVTVLGATDTVVLRPGDDIQARVDGAREGTVFRLTRGVYRQQRVVPKNGMTFFGEPGTVLTGEEVIDHAFLADVEPYPRNVVVRGLVIERYLSALQTGAIRADAAMAAWTIEDCEVRDNSAGGIQIGPRARILRNRVHHNSQIGILGSGDGVLVEGNEVAYNNPEGEHDMYWEAGGTKFTRTRDLVVRRNFVHHNGGPGLWTDIDNVRTLVEANRVEDNVESGIFHEIGYAAVIRDNVARRNGAGAVPADWVSGAGIIVSSSSDVEVYGNTVEDNHNGITAIEAHRGTGAYGPYVLRDLYVHDNTIRMRAGATGVATSGVRRLIDRSTYRSRHNRFDANRYVFGAGAHYFRWSGRWLTDAQWRAVGHDTGGRFVRETRPAGGTSTPSAAAAQHAGR